MKTLLIAIMSLGFSGAAMADGFVCDTLDGNYTVKMYNHTSPSKGTRNGAVMIISDNNVMSGRKTIATFDTELTLWDREGAQYVANVDLRTTGAGRAGENVFGTKLGQIDTIKLNIAFLYSAPVKAGQELDAQLVVTKRNGQKGKIEAVCSRYLKNR
jgi:hypothetical protein